MKDERQVGPRCEQKRSELVKKRYYQEFVPEVKHCERSVKKEGEKSPETENSSVECKGQSSQEHFYLRSKPRLGNTHVFSSPGM